MEPFPVVEQLNVPENGLPHVFDVRMNLLLKETSAFI
jgi:hypothetical protein